MSLSVAVKDRLRTLVKLDAQEERKPMPNLITNRLLNAPFLSQIRSIQRTRYEKPERLVAWFKHLEITAEWKGEYETLQASEKDEFYSLQMAFEAIMERPFSAIQHRAITTTKMADAFSVLEDYVKVVARKLSNGLMVVGPGGIGKSYTVTDTIKKEKLKEGQHYVKIRGYSSPLALYNSLFEYSDKLVVFDRPEYTEGRPRIRSNTQGSLELNFYESGGAGVYL
jgi:hypothetical protein